MKSRLLYGLIAATLLMTAPLTRAAEAACAASAAEVEALRARVRELEAALAPAAAATPATAALPGTAPRPAMVTTVTVEPAYSRTGCTRGLLGSIADAPWRDADRWADLKQGDAPAHVEALLGPEHFDEQGGGNVVWHYGRCGKRSMAQALFTNGRLAEWRAPSP